MEECAQDADFLLQVAGVGKQFVRIEGEQIDGFERRRRGTERPRNVGGFDVVADAVIVWIPIVVIPSLYRTLRPGQGGRVLA